MHAGAKQGRIAISCSHSSFAYVHSRSVIQGQVVWSTPSNLSSGGAQIWARPLQTPGEWALHFINAGAAAVDLVCDADCFATMGGLPAGYTIGVRDVWAHQDLQPLTSPTFTVGNLAAAGGSMLYKLTWIAPAEDHPLIATE